MDTPHLLWDTTANNHIDELITFGTQRQSDR